QRIYLSEQDEYDLKFNRYLNFYSFMIDEPWQSMRDVILPDAGMLDGVATANNFDPLLPERYATWLKAVDGASPEQKAGLLALMNVGTVESLASDGSSNTQWTAVEGAKRVHFAEEAIPASDGEDALQKTLALAGDGAGVWDRNVVIEGANPDNSAGSIAGEAQIVIESEEPDQIAMTVNSDEAGWLVLSDVNYPGWQVWADGEEKPIHTANSIFRAVQLDAGEHQVVWRYRPGSFRVGAWISAVGAVIFLAGWLMILRQKVAKDNS
ncbi:MAG: YfhO family protein, partial [Anaerolineaceae bacterium]